MRYHYEKPNNYSSFYGKRYACNHPVYDTCTLYLIRDRGLTVIQQRFDPETKAPGGMKSTRGWLTLYICIPGLSSSLMSVLGLVRTVYIPPSRSVRSCGL